MRQVSFVLDNLNVGRGEVLTSCGNLLAGSGDTNDDALTPTLVASLEGCPHDTDITSAVKSVVAATVREFDKLLLDRLALELSRVDEVSSTKLLGPLLLAGVHVDNNDLASLLDDCTLHHGETDTAGTEDGDSRALLDIGGDPGGTVTGGDTATQQTGSVHGSILLNGNNGDISHDSVLGEGRSSHEVEEVLALALESRGAIGHHTLTLGGSDLAAQVRLARLAELALLTFRRAVKKGIRLAMCTLASRMRRSLTCMRPESSMRWTH